MKKIIPAIREPHVYEQEVDFMLAVTEAEAKALETLIDKSCKCEVLEGEKFWVDKSCEDAAKLVQTVRARVPYHASMMLHLGGILKERPAESPPEVPDASLLCPDA
jgi:hypothetical protein